MFSPLLQRLHILLCVCCFLVCVGCESERPQRRVMPSDERKMAIDAGQDHLNLAFEFIDEFHRYAENEIIPRIHYHLSEWIQSQQADDDWIAEPMFSRLPSRLNISNRQAALSKLEFNDADVVMLREAVWIRDVAKQVANRDVSDPRLNAWLNDDANGLQPTSVRDLRYAIESFDWAVRNVQLEGRRIGADIAEATSAEIPGEGQFRTSWEALLLSRGEMASRARIMILICRQLNVPVVMLGIDPDDESTDDPKPWALGALVGKDLYLFDARYALPILTKDRKQIATLAEVIEDPGILSEMDVEGRKYRIQEGDLKRVVAMIDATMPYLSQRMAILERKLTGDQKLKLTVSPSSLAQALRKSKGISRVEIWTQPYDVISYRRSQFGNQQFIRTLSFFVAPFSGDTALANGRRLHFAGKYRNDPPNKGAKAYYMDCRVPDATIERPQFTEELKNTLDIASVVLPDDPQIVRQFVAAQSARLRIFKRFASYWLGVIALEEGKFKVAEDYFDKRTLQANPDGEFEVGARYGLARALEGRGLRDNDKAAIERAIEIYEADDSPQAAGNKLRARWLRESRGDE